MIDSASHTMRPVEIYSIFEEKPVSLTVEFRGRVEGPTCPARSTRSEPDEEIELVVRDKDDEGLVPRPAWKA